MTAHLVNIPSNTHYFAVSGSTISGDFCTIVHQAVGKIKYLPMLGFCNVAAAGSAGQPMPKQPH
jgi:hypothetical protein